MRQSVSSKRRDPITAWCSVVFQTIGIPMETAGFLKTSVDFLQSYWAVTRTNNLTKCHTPQFMPVDAPLMPVMVIWVWSPSKCKMENHIHWYGCLSLVSVVCCQVAVCASGWSLVQRSPTKSGVSECDREALMTRTPWPTRGCCAMGKRIYTHFILQALKFSWRTTTDCTQDADTKKCLTTVVLRWPNTCSACSILCSL